MFEPSEPTNLEPQRVSRTPQQLPRRVTYPRAAKKPVRTDIAKRRLPNIPLDKTDTDHLAKMSDPPATDTMLQLIAHQTQLQMERWKREDIAREEERKEQVAEREANTRRLELEAQERERQERQRQREFQQLTDTVTALTIAQAKPKLHPPKLEPFTTGDMLEGEFT